MFLWMVACRPGPGPTPPTPEFRTLAEAAGRVVQTGTLVYGEYDRCCELDSSCFFSNASSPYGVYDLPPSPGQTVEDVDLQPGTPSFHLRPDEAVVFLGRTPPEAAYFGWRSYLAWRQEPSGPAAILGSLGPALNHQVVGRSRGDGPLWDSPFAVVTTADAAVERDVVGWLEAAGWDPATLSVDRIPADLVRLGLTTEADAFTGVMRVALFRDPEAGAAYLASPGEVLRVTPAGEAPAAPREPHPVVTPPWRGSGTDEEAWRPAVEALGAAVRRGWPDHWPVDLASEPWWFEPYACIEDGFCSFDSTDRYYARVPSLVLPDDGSFAVAYGVNHAVTGKGAYANVTVESVENMTGLAGVDSDAFPGSARSLLPDEPLVDDLYAVVVARRCADFPGLACIEVPTGCPGVDLDERMVVDFRVYLEPATGAAPLPEELVLDRVVKFFPRR